MKLNINTTSDAQVYGELKQNKVSIDIKNIDFITQILSTNLYSNPLDSFLREIISNAIDSNKEAGTTDPVILDIGKTVSGKFYIRIQDFGTGISKERFDEIYRFIGSSTKRESNDYIGSFGIGRFSVLAIGDSATITSCYNGVKTKYLMYKDGISINIDEVSSIDTKERNGVEVYVEPSITIDYVSLSRAVKQLIFFDDVYINVSNLKESNNGYYSYHYERYKEFVNLVNRFNDKKNIEFKTFKVPCVDIGSQFSILLGNVVYNVDSSHFNNYSKYKNYQGDYIIFPKFKIGELSVTPNRESLLYDSKTEEALNNKLKEVDNELFSLIEDRYGLDVDYKFFTKICDDFIYKFSKDDELAKTQNVSIKNDDFLTIVQDKITIYGEKFSDIELNELAKIIRGLSPFTVTHSYDGRIIRTKQYDIPLYKVARGLVTNGYRTDKTTFFRNEMKNFNFYLKQYMKENYNSFTLLKPRPVKDVLHDFRCYNYEHNAKIGCVYIRALKDLWSSFDVVDESLIDDEFKKRFSTAKSDKIKSENINVITVKGLNKMQEKMTVGCFIDQKAYLNVYFSEIESDIPTELSRIPQEILFKDDDLAEFSDKTIRFVQVSEKVKKEIAGEDNMIHYTELLKPSRYWMRLLKTWKDDIKNRYWYSAVTTIDQFCIGVSSKTRKFIKDFTAIKLSYDLIKSIWKYVLPFEKDIESIDNLIEDPTDEVYNNIILCKRVKDFSNTELASMLFASIGNVDVDAIHKERYQKILNLISNDKEHNQNKQISERDAQ